MNGSIAQYCDHLSELDSSVATQTKQFNENLKTLQTALEYAKDDIETKKKQFFKMEGLKKAIFLIACACQPFLVGLLIYLIFHH